MATVKKIYRLSGGVFEREEGVTEAKRLFFLSVEGDRTEPSYFINLNRVLRDYGVSDAIIHVLKHPHDGLSSPEDVYSLLEECIRLREKGELFPIPVLEQLKQEFNDEDIAGLLEGNSGLSQERQQRFNEILLSLGINKDYRMFIATKPSSRDRFAVVIDRDCGNHSKECLEKVISKCMENDYFCCLTNPCFEFWLLLHLVAIDMLSSPEELLKITANEKMSRKHTYVSRRVSSEAKHAKYISERTFDKYYKNTLRLAMKAASVFATDEVTVLEQIGTTIPKLIKEIFGVR